MFASMCARRRDLGKAKFAKESVERTFYSAAHGKVAHALGAEEGRGLQESNRLWKFGFQ